MLHSRVHLFQSLAGSWLLAGMSVSEKKQSFPLAGLVCFAWDAVWCWDFSDRQAAIIAWFVHVCAAESGALLAYGADNFITMALFYLMLSPLPDRYSVDCRLIKRKLADPRLLGFWRRVLQIHLCFVYFFGGLAKLLGSGWWNGSNLWRSLIRPPFNLLSPDILVRFKYVLPVLGISICLIEIGYPVFIWIKKTRFLWLVCILAMHAAIGLTMGMYLFALVMIVLNLAAFGVGIRVPFIRHPVSGPRHLRSFFRSSNSARNESGRCDVPRRLICRTWRRRKPRRNPAKSVYF